VGLQVGNLEQRPRRGDDLAALDQRCQPGHRSLRPRHTSRYLIQDHRFLDSFLVLLGAAFASADTFAARLRFGRFTGMASAEENIYFLRAFETLGVTETRRAAQHTAYTRVDGWLTLGTYYRDGLGFVSLPDPGPGKEQLLRGVGC
jgi:hypothetical protein